MSLQEYPNREIGVCSGSRHADDFTAQLFDGFGVFAAEQRVIGVVRERSEDPQVESARVAANRGLGAADAAKLYVAGHQRGDRCRPAAH